MHGKLSCAACNQGAWAINWCCVIGSREHVGGRGHLLNPGFVAAQATDHKRSRPPWRHRGILNCKAEQGARNDAASLVQQPRGNPSLSSTLSANKMRLALPALCLLALALASNAHVVRHLSSAGPSKRAVELNRGRNYQELM
jgi:hypothetical protein